MSVGVMGELKLCRNLTKDKLGKSGKSKYTYFVFMLVWFSVRNYLRSCWVKNVEKVNALFIVKILEYLTNWDCCSDILTSTGV